MLLVPGSTASLCLSRFQPVVHVETSAVDPDRAPIVVVGRISLALRIEARLESREQSSTVLAFPDVLPGVVETAITDQEIQATAGKI
jgi:hypothetical protein